MIGDGYWSTGIIVTYSAGSHYCGWGAKVQFLDDGFCDDDADAGQVSTEGTLHTRYSVPPGKAVDALTAAIDTVKADAERLGITWRVGPYIYYEGDGHDEEFPPPDGWRELLTVHAERLGWRTPYRPEARP